MPNVDFLLWYPPIQQQEKSDLLTKIMIMIKTNWLLLSVSLFAAEKRRKRYLWSKSPLPIFSCFNQRRIEYGKTIFFTTKWTVYNNFMGKVNSEQCRLDHSQNFGFIILKKRAGSLKSSSFLCGCHFAHDFFIVTKMFFSVASGRMCLTNCKMLKDLLFK